MPPVISKGEKMFGYGFTGTVDAIQFALDFFVATAWINNIIDFVMLGILGFYAIKRKLLNPHKTLVLGATFFAEQIPFVNALPFWVYDMHNLYKGTVTTNPEPVDTSNLPLNSGGVRRPRNLPQPLNSGGTRPPRKV